MRFGGPAELPGQKVGGTLGAAEALIVRLPVEMRAADENVRERPGVLGARREDDLRVDVRKALCYRPAERAILGGQREDLGDPASVPAAQMLGGLRRKRGAPLRRAFRERRKKRFHRVARSAGSPR